MKKVLISVITIAAVGALAFGASRAFFSDTETSTGNTFTAGAIDLKVDSTASYNGDSYLAGTWGQIDPGVDITNEKFFNFTDIKPGDWGENTISMHVINNNAWACLTIGNMQNNENTCTEPEGSVDGSCGGTDTVGAGLGELAQNIYFTAWADDGDNIWQPTEPLLFTNLYGPASDVLNGRTYALADSTTGTPIAGGQTRYIGLKWCFGTMTVNVGTGTMACDGSTTGNITQTDSLTADVSFEVVQARNNETFVCSSVTNGRQRLVLENKDPDYNRLLNDGIYGVLTFNSSAATFDYDFEAYGLALSSPYKLIYYADGWAGNHPGALIGTFTTDASGNINVSGQTIELNMDLPTSPDTNYPTGAKIWLIPGAAYTDGTFSVNTWPFANDWLFESNLIIYNDTGV